ncbi:DUF4351 domain-containing protein [Halomonas litopenaei]|uniref:DUF4351 domain-containing protein n=1 Tax=Halomonas litopenaei TaxID=2109328 RepID=UPI003F9FE3FF
MLAENLENLVKKEQQQGETRMLAKQMRRKFGELPEWAKARLDSASTEQLDTWGERILTANTLDELFKQ